MSTGYWNRIASNLFWVEYLLLLLTPLFIISNWYSIFWDFYGIGNEVSQYFHQCKGDWSLDLKLNSTLHPTFSAFSTRHYLPSFLFYLLHPVSFIYALYFIRAYIFGYSLFVRLSAFKFFLSVLCLMKASDCWNLLARYRDHSFQLLLYKLDSTAHGHFSESLFWKSFNQTCGLHYAAHKNPTVVNHILTIAQKIPCDSNILSRRKGWVRK